MDYIAIDCGSSSIKAMVSGSNEAYRDWSLAIIPEEVEKYEEDVLEYKGLSYLVGEVAKVNSGNRRIETSPNNEVDFHGSDRQAAMLCGVFDDFELHKESKIKKLVLTVPYDMRTKYEILDKIKSRNCFEWSRNILGRRELRRVEFEQVEVVPQGVGAAVQHNVLDNSEYETIGILEIGSVTIEAIYMEWSEKKQQHQYNKTISQSLRNLAVQDLYDDMRSRLAKVPGLQKREFSFYELCKLLENPEYKVRVGSVEIDQDEVKKKIKEARTVFTERLEDEAKTAWGNNNWERLSVLIISGGGAEALNQPMWKCKKRTYFGDGYDNVRGSVKFFEQ